ncbi:hypothetical protein E3N88_31791 [Mikania micrantha]|uniref:Calmodulin-binding domain-containing protein n=1 Tax=Mikania micrantha TaxID=192012 RepID=A0A5N6M6Z6_9ASTR|nr:hypothetical protein E3N88_31791 [Mikania micrantha]
MVNESSLIQEIGESKKPQLDCTSPKSSLNQGDSDIESTSVSSSMQGSISSATSSLDRYSSNVKDETLQKKPLKKPISKKVASYGSFMSSRRRAHSKLSQSSIKLSDDDSITPPHPSSIEVSDESSNYVQKPMPKFTRTGSLRSVKIFRTNRKNKSSSKSKESSTENVSQISEESHLERATFSSILKDSKFPEDLKHQPRPSEPEEVLPVAKFCPYQHCSLHGHHHHHEPPTKRFAYLKRRTTNSPKIATPKARSSDISFDKTREPKSTKKASGRKINVDHSIEFYAKTRSEPLSGHDYDDAEFADILFGVNSPQETKNTIPTSNNRDFSDLNDTKDHNSDGSKRILEGKQSLKKKNHLSMWHTIQQQIVFGLAAESGDIIVQKVDEEQKPDTKDDQSTTSEVISEQDLSEKGEIQSDQKEVSLAPVANEKTKVKPDKETPSRWSHLKKVILLTKFVKELEKVKKFNPKKPHHLPLPPVTETVTETVSLRRQTGGGKKNTDEWMLDYALQKVVSELAPTQKRKVALLVKAFETVAPAQDDPQESNTCNEEIERVGSKSKGELSESSSFAEKIEESELKLDMEKEKHIKMWHMIYQHVVTDIATKIGSDLLVDDEESTNSEDKNLQEVEDQTERKYRLQFTQSDAVKLIQESVDEILHPDDSSSHDAQSVASDITSEQETDEHKKLTVERPLLQHQKSKNWVKLKNMLLLKRSIRALEGFRKVKPQTPQQNTSISDHEHEHEHERVDLRRQMMDEHKKAEQWMLDYAVQHIVTKLTPARKKRVSMLVEAFEAVVPFPEF